ncbi:MAG TPA: DUF1697 domain-containing protein [Steroidobacteraceae bacterium]|jgi:uncharacterized protein (DUF1697 family)|nr:DUF1697 domain-containing protein [Steroidobacteraceae bacterium]
MPKFVALLRGINVGKAKRVPMADLRALLIGLGHTHVATLLNSGNAVFQAGGGSCARHAKDISGAIAARLKVDVPVVVKSLKELSSIIAENPIDAEAEEYPRLLVAFVQDSKSLRDLSAIGALVIAPERFALGRSAAYLLCAKGILESKAAVALLGQAGRVATSRNLATVLKLAALANAGS